MKNLMFVFVVIAMLSGAKAFAGKCTDVNSNSGQKSASLEVGKKSSQEDPTGKQVHK